MNVSEALEAAADPALAAWMDDHEAEIDAAVEEALSEAEAAQPEAAPPLPASFIDDIPQQTARGAYYWISHSPERRGDAVRAEYVATLEDAQKRLQDVAKTPESRARVAELFDRYRRGYRARVLAWLGAMSRTASTMITGGSGFNVGRNQKRQATERRRAAEMSSYREGALNRAIKDLNEEDKEATGGTLADLKRRLENAKKTQEIYKQTNAILRRKGTAEQKIEWLMEGLSLKREEVDLLLKPDVFGHVGIPSYRLSNNLAEIKRLEGRVRVEEIRSAVRHAEYPFSGGTVIYNPEAERIQIKFDGRPDADMIGKLKRAAFKWAPSVGMWQRQLTHNAVYATRQLLGIDLPYLVAAGRPAA